MNWYRFLISQTEENVPSPVPTEPPASAQPTIIDDRPVVQPQTEPPAGLLEEVMQDLLRGGQNLERIAEVDVNVKTAGVTNHWRHPKFNDSFSLLPKDIKDMTRRNFRKMITNPSLVGLKTMPGPSRRYNVSMYSAKIGPDYRTLAVKFNDQYVWFWCGSHQEYNRRKDMPPPNFEYLSKFKQQPSVN